MVEITNGAGIRRIIEDRHNILKEQSAKLDFNTEGWKKAVGYNNSLSVLENETNKIGDKDLVLLAESSDDYDIEIKKAKKQKVMLEMFYVKSCCCALENDSKYFVIYLSKI